MIPTDMNQYSLLEISHRYVLGKLPTEYQKPNLGIICGSGLSNLGTLMTDPISIPYGEIPNFPKPTVEGHGTQLLVGKLNGVVTACLLGRFHYYEGHDPTSVVFPVRLLTLLGITTLLVTNAAGSVDPNFRVGDVMVIEDHISFLSLAGINPLRGPNDQQLGPRFPALTEAYYPKSFELVKETAEECGLAQYIRRGVYCGVGGPTYETPSEIRMMRMLGGGSVGMSTVPEVIAAVHCGITVVGLSLITNIGISRELIENGLFIPKPTHAEVLLATKERAKDMEKLVFQMSPKLSKIHKL